MNYYIVLVILVLMIVTALIPYPTHVAPEINLQLLKIGDRPIGNLELSYIYSKFPLEICTDNYKLDKDGKIKLGRIVVWRNFIVRSYWFLVNNLTSLGVKLPYVSIIIKIPSDLSICVEQNNLERVSESYSLTDAKILIFEDKLGNIITIVDGGSPFFEFKYKVKRIWKKEQVNVKLYFKGRGLVAS